MKKSFLLPLTLGLLLVGCSRTNTDAQKVSATDQNDPNKPTYNDQAITARKQAADQSKVAANPTPTPMPGKDTASTAPQTASTPSSATSPAASSVAANPASPTPDAASASRAATIPPASSTPVPEVASASEAKLDLPARMSEWKLNPDDIRSELASSGEIVRAKKIGAGEPTGPMDGLIISQVSSKLRDEASTSALAIDVSADKGIVTLQGSAKSLEQIGKAIAISLDTPGVVQTVSKIKLEESK